MKVVELVDRILGIQRTSKMALVGGGYGRPKISGKYMCCWRSSTKVHHLARSAAHSSERQGDVAPQDLDMWHIENMSCGDLIEAITQTWSKLTCGKRPKEPARLEGAARSPICATRLSFFGYKYSPLYNLQPSNPYNPSLLSILTFYPFPLEFCTPTKTFDPWVLGK